GDDEVVAGHEGARIVDLGLEIQGHAEFGCTLLQKLEQRHAANAAEAVAGGDGARAAIDDGDVVPIGEVVADGGSALRVVGGKVVERFVGQDHAPAEGVVGAVAFV